MTRGKHKLWWTLEEDEGFNEIEREIGDPNPTFATIDEEEREGSGILDANGNQIERPAKVLGFLMFGED